MNPLIRRTIAAFGAIVAIFALALTPTTAEEVYKKPPKEILDVLNAPAPPGASVSPARDYLLLVRSDRYPPISEVSQPMLRLAGLRINPRSNSPHLPQTFIEFV